MEAWDLVDAERKDFADLCDSLTEEQWNTPSLCDAWRVRDVVAHVTQGATMTLGTAFAGLFRYGFRVKTGIERAAISGGRTAPAQLAEQLHATIGNRNTPPGSSPSRTLTGEMVHQQDVRRPLQIPRTIPADRVRLALDDIRNTGIKLLPGKRRAAGLHLYATDIDWDVGDADLPAISGTGEALLMAMAGRHAALEDLSGPGVRVLQSSE